MKNILTLTLEDNKFYGQPYVGSPSQSFNIVPSSDGSVSIRHFYQDLALSMSGNEAWASPYTGDHTQRFNLEKHKDGSSTLHSAYYSVVLEMTDSGVEVKTYIPGDQNQRFSFTTNSAEGSTRIQTANLVFNTNEVINNLQGSLVANVQFAQSQIFPTIPKAADPQPYLIAKRKMLLMVKPRDNIDSLEVSVFDKEGKTLGSLPMNSPDQLPDTVYHLDGDLGDIDFTPLPGTIYLLNDSSELELLSDPAGTFLLQKLQLNSVVDIHTTDGAWVDEIHLPSSAALEGKIVRFSSTAGYETTVIYSGREVLVSQQEAYEFKFTSEQWISDAEAANQGLLYSENTWSVDIPSEWITPGIGIFLETGDLIGLLNNIQVGGATELILNTIDIGMLTPPRDAYIFAKDPAAHREYFQTLPAARMIVSDFESIYLNEVMLPDGTLLTDFDPSEGGWHEGTMRQTIGKELISLGINHANYGINCSEGEGEWSPYMAALITAHNSCGKYSNGIQVHGGSGGGGIVTLENSIGNEFSHEVGHNYELDHYPGGFDGSVHRAADQINSTWGWDSDLNRFIPNFSAEVTNQDVCLVDECQSPFHGRAFGADPMAGGEPMSQANRFTLHTPYTAAITQGFMESKVVFASDSSTGFRKWDPATKTMEPFVHRVDLYEPAIASNDDLSEAALSRLFIKNQIVKVVMSDGNWAETIHVPPASSSNAQCILSIDHDAGYDSDLYINGRIISVAQGFKKNYVSTGFSWNECILLDTSMTRVTARNEYLSQSDIASLLALYNVVNISMTDGNWAASINVPPASQINGERVVTLANSATYSTQLYINGLSIELSKDDKKYYLSDGENWREYLHLNDISIERSPQEFGVPVTTLVGYYDPRGELQSYIYPALHGAYGFIYADDSSMLLETDYQLWVESEDKILRFKLNGNRIHNHVMNKFHINIAESEQTRTVSLVCNGNVIIRQAIEPAKRPLTYTINGA
ncbi:M66 family metalloprotease [Pseudomonas versuta]|uniref:ToxR-regulated lipoprotein n=1 Tax=Pseudomonas versuta TaxID=1788301 RepID=A0ABX3E455_9PSED|nr:M66 family metalloprotease [Pseudomonas versuta]ALE90187.1 ToxR-regulated lipoprotein [Pseudomonas versuta]OKA17763.1 ToxR-regulated lipoprotein [Pseudomonas versuta]